MVLACSAAFSMSYYTYSKYGSKLLCVYGGMAYASCGFVLQYYSNIQYLDIVMMFPILILALERLIKERKCILYIIVLALLFLTNQQMVFMVGIYVILKGWLLIRRMEKADRGRAIADFAICSVIGILLSAFSLIPSTIVMVNSARFSKDPSGSWKDVLVTLNCEFQVQKNFMLYGGEIGVGCLLYVLCKEKERIREYADSLILVLLLVIPIALENVNLLWHGGSYVHFPMRFGYILSFELICVAIKAVSDTDMYKMVESGMKGRCLGITGLVLIPLAAWRIADFDKGFVIKGILELSSYEGYWFIFGILVVAVVMVCFWDNKTVKIGVMLVITLVQAGFGMYGFIAPTGTTAMENGDCFISLSDEVNRNIEIENEVNRIKDRNISLDVNYGFTVAQSSLGGWMNGLSPRLQDAMYRMGYSVNYTRVLDNGGTAFTDAMLGVNRIYAKTDVNNELYAYKSNVGTGNIYGSKYTMPFGFIMDDVQKGDDFEYQNDLFRAATGLDSNLIEEFEINENNVTREVIDEQNGISIFDVGIPVNSESVLYICADYNDEIYNKYSFVVNEEQQLLGVREMVDNVMYAQLFLDRILEFGTYENEIVNLKIITCMDSLEHIHVGLMPLDTLQEGIDAVKSNNTSNAYTDKGKLVIEFESETGGNLFVPIAFYGDYEVVVDGVKSDYHSMMEEAFWGLNVNSGKHIIEIEYVPKGLIVGIVLSVIGFVIGIVVIKHRKKYFIDDKLNVCFECIYNGISIIIVLTLYVVPFVAMAIRIFTR